MRGDPVEENIHKLELSTSKSTEGDRKECFRCGSQYHLAYNCGFINSTCFNCGKNVTQRESAEVKESEVEIRKEGQQVYRSYSQLIVDLRRSK